MNISLLSSNERVKCVLAPGGSWVHEINMCTAEPQKNCTENIQNAIYKDRVTFIDTNKLQIKDVRINESGIYKCETVFEHSIVLISGIFIVGMFSLLSCYLNHCPGLN